MSALTATCILKTLSFYSPLEASPQDHSRSCPAVFAALPHGCLVGPLNLSMIKTTCQALQASLSLAFPSSADSITSHPIAHTKDWDLTPDSLSLTHSPCNPEQVIGTSPLNDHNSVSTRLSASVLAPLLFAVHTDAGPVDLKHKSDHIALLHEALRGVPPALKSKPRPALQALLSGFSPRLWTCYLLFQFHCISGYSCFLCLKGFSYFASSWNTLLWDFQMTLSSHLRSQLKWCHIKKSSPRSSSPNSPPRATSLSVSSESLYFILCKAPPTIWKKSYVFISFGFWYFSGL